MALPYVYLDIETLPADDADPILAEHLAAIGIADPDAVAAPLLEEAAERAAEEAARAAEGKPPDGRRTSAAALRAKAEDARGEADRKRRAAIDATALMPTLGRVLCVGYAIDGGEAVILDGAPAPFGSLDAEARILDDLAGMIARAPRGLRWVGHNLAGFDAPYLQTRALVRSAGRDLLRVFGPPDAKPWQRPIDDTRLMWPALDGERRTKGALRLDRLAAVLGIERQGPDAVMGADVAQAYRDGRHDAIRAHLRADVEQVRALHRRLLGLDADAVALGGAA